MGLPERARPAVGPVAPVHELREIAGRVAPVALAGEQLLPALDVLQPLLPGRGLRRGTVVGVSGSVTLALALLAGPSQAGSWTAVVGLPGVGMLAASELGVDLARCALVPDPGPTWPTVVAALLDAIDVVAVAVPLRGGGGGGGGGGRGGGGGGGGGGRVRAADARRLAARARERGSVLVVVVGGSAVGGSGSAGSGSGSAGSWAGAGAWPEGPDVRLSVAPSGGVSWDGLDCGHGALRRRRLSVVGSGRGAAARERRAKVDLP